LSTKQEHQKKVSHVNKEINKKKGKEIVSGIKGSAKRSIFITTFHQ
jgi:hypothetical protein